jgi:glutamate/tyrosine decarboxylase-like PLP-dependent enzyme
MLQDVCGAGGLTPAYLSTSDTSIPSPLNVGLENSRRFRALPLYCSLLSYGKEGYTEIIQRNVTFARRVEEWLSKHEGYDVLTPLSTTCGGAYKILNIVLFAPSAACGRAEYHDPSTGGMKLCDKLKERGVLYTTPTVWKGRSAVRLAVSNWQTGLREEEYERVVQELDHVITQ